MTKNAFVARTPNPTRGALSQTSHLVGRGLPEFPKKPTPDLGFFQAFDLKVHSCAPISGYAYAFATKSQTQHASNVTTFYTLITDANTTNCP